MELITTHPKLKGEISQAIILAEFVKAGFSVLIPFGDSRRYDLAIDLDGKLIRIQCKTGHIENCAVEFVTCSSACHTKNGRRRDYKGEADYFAVFCPQNEKIYLVPVGECGNTEARLRLTPPLNGQTVGIRFAEDFEFKGKI